MNKLKNQPWYNHAVALCIAVVLLVLLIRFDNVWSAVQHFFGYFMPVILGCVIAYIVNPLSDTYKRVLFKKIKKERTQLILSNLLAFITVLLFLAFFLLMVIPQLVESVTTFARNLNGYYGSIAAFLEERGLSLEQLHLNELLSSTENMVNTIIELVRNNLDRILSTSASAGRGAISVVIAFLLSVYLLADKQNLKAGGKRLFKGLLREDQYTALSAFLGKCHSIMNRYIIFNLVDSLIVGIANAIFMAILGMPYIGLVSFVVSVTNLIPTFGPFVGAAIGAFVLLLEQPWYALAFLIFTIVLQAVDGYVIKPKLFGDSLGVSGLFILIGIIVGGRIWGMVGILIAIPGVAILDLLYRDYFLPWLEKRRRRIDLEEKREKEVDTVLKK